MSNNLTWMRWVNVYVTVCFLYFDVVFFFRYYYLLHRASSNTACIMIMWQNALSLRNVHLILAGGGWVEIVINSEFFCRPPSRAWNLHNIPDIQISVVRRPKQGMADSWVMGIHGDLFWMVLQWKQRRQNAWDDGIAPTAKLIGDFNSGKVTLETYRHFQNNS